MDRLSLLHAGTLVRILVMMLVLDFRFATFFLFYVSPSIHFEIQATRCTMCTIKKQPT